MGDAQHKPHAIIFPLPFQGHINPFVNLALKLASRGYAITFVHFEFVHQKLAKAHYKSTNINDQIDFFSEARKFGLDIRCRTISDGFPPNFNRDNHLDLVWKSFLEDFPDRMEEFVGNLIKKDVPSLVSFLISDTFFPCAADIAKKYNIVHVSFFTQPALVFNIGYHLDLMAEKGHFPCQEDTDEEINYLPGVESISTKDLISYFKQAKKGNIIYQFRTTTFKEVRKADFILHNTIQELEANTLKALSGVKSTYAIGPMISSITITNTSKITIPKSFWSESDCTKWLDSKPPGSVLYVSLGSVVATSKEAIQELAHGLLLSNVYFIWVVRTNLIQSNSAQILREGYEDEIREKGLIVPWCNQIMILSHPALGGFLTHCGFNSALESLWCGVPMICYPIMYDQPIVRILIVNDWKVGINLIDGTSINREEVSQKIKSLIHENTFEGLRQQVNKLKNTMRNALEIKGSSGRNFDQFITDLEAKIY